MPGTRAHPRQAALATADLALTIGLEESGEFQMDH
jgi:hypothetical protein